jgi:hypothetical protein
MAKNIDKLADILGARIVAQVPEFGGGAFGAYRLGAIVARMQARFQAAQGKQNGRSTVAESLHDHPLPMSDETFKKLEELAAKVSTTEHKVAPMQLAAQLLEDAIARCSDTQ